MVLLFVRILYSAKENRGTDSKISEKKNSTGAWVKYAYGKNKVLLTFL